MYQCLGKLEDERVLGIKGKIHFAANDEILLRVIRSAPRRSEKSNKTIVSAACNLTSTAS